MKNGEMKQKMCFSNQTCFGCEHYYYYSNNHPHAEVMSDDPPDRGCNLGFWESNFKEELPDDNLEHHTANTCCCYKDNLKKYKKKRILKQLNDLYIKINTYR